MVGIIQKVLMDLVAEDGGPEAVAAVRTAAGVPEDRIFRLGVNYDDAECRRLFEAAAEHLGLEEEAFWERYADAFLRDALRRWPTWFAMSPTAQAFLARQPVIHNCFAAGLRDPHERRAVADKFLLEENVPGELVLTYRSPNRLSALYVALARRVLAHYGEQAEIEVTPLEADGPEEVVRLRVRWAAPAPVPSR